MKYTYYQMLCRNSNTKWIFRYFKKTKKPNPIDYTTVKFCLQDWQNKITTGDEMANFSLPFFSLLTSSLAVKMETARPFTLHGWHISLSCGEFSEQNRRRYYIWVWRKSNIKIFTLQFKKSKPTSKNIIFPSVKCFFRQK